MGIPCIYKQKIIGSKKLEAQNLIDSIEITIFYRTNYLECHDLSLVDAGNLGEMEQSYGYSILFASLIASWNMLILTYASTSETKHQTNIIWKNHRSMCFEIEENFHQLKLELFR